MWTNEPRVVKYRVVQEDAAIYFVGMRWAHASPFSRITRSSNVCPLMITMNEIVIVSSQISKARVLSRLDRLAPRSQNFVCRILLVEWINGLER